MPLEAEPHIPLDPVSGFFAGFTSVFARMFIGLAGIIAGYLICSFSAWGFDSHVMAWFPLGCIFTIFTWGTYGGLFLAGLAALVSIFAGLWAFVNGSDGKRAFFFIVTASVVYFLPVVLPEKRTNIYGEEIAGSMRVGPLAWAAGIYIVAAILYWVAPGLIAKMTPGRGEEEVETCAPTPESNHENIVQQSEYGGEPMETGDDLPLTGAEPLEHPADEEMGEERE